MRVSDQQEEVTLVRKRGRGIVGLFAFLIGVGLILVPFAVANLAYRKGQADARVEIAAVRHDLEGEYRFFAKIAREASDNTIRLATLVNELAKSVEELDSAVVTVRPPRKSLPPITDFRSPHVPATLKEALSDSAAK